MYRARNFECSLNVRRMEDQTDPSTTDSVEICIGASEGLFGLHRIRRVLQAGVLKSTDHGGIATRQSTCPRRSLIIRQLRAKGGNNGRAHHSFA